MLALKTIVPVPDTCFVWFLLVLQGKFAITMLFSVGLGVKEHRDAVMLLSQHGLGSFLSTRLPLRNLARRDFVSLLLALLPKLFRGGLRRCKTSF